MAESKVESTISPQYQLNFMYLLERVGQPLYLGPHGHGETRVLYNLPQDQLESYEVKAMASLREKIGTDTEINIVTVSTPAEAYDLTPVLVVPKLGMFSYFSPVHRQAADTLTKIFMDQPNIDEFFNVCATCRDKVNPHLWIHSYLSGCLFRKDMRGFVIPPAWEIMPDLFFEPQFLREAQRQGQLPLEDRAIVIINQEFTGFDTNPNNKVAYFAEDMGINSHHWHWHLANPETAPPGTIDRKGERFSYMHHNMIARYNTERLANGLNRTLPMDLQEVVDEAYFSKLTIDNSRITYGGRQEKTKPRDINRIKDPNLPFVATLSDLRVHGDRINEAIDAGFAISVNRTQFSTVNLKNDKGIDLIGAMVEASNDSINFNYYGGLHDYGHIIMSVCQDPDFRYKDPPGVMISTAVAVRDPTFFRWHMYVEMFFRRHKETLDPYTKEYLLWNEVSISKFEVKTPGIDPIIPNSLLTYWMQSDVDLSRGLDFGRTDLNNLGPVWARIKHLQHRNFVYNITVNYNGDSSDVQGTVRIFMAPKNDEHGDTLTFEEQRNLFFEMDRFSIKLQPGVNEIQRRSEDSTVTIPFAQTFRQLERNVRTPKGVEAFCGCGWPDYLLVPKGTHSGMPCDLFVMLSDGQVDKVSSTNGIPSETEKHGCRDSASFCGILNELYPDSRPMGFPFDKLPQTNEQGQPPNFVKDFTAPFPNMATTEVKIFNRNVTMVREGGAPSEMRKVLI